MKDRILKFLNHEGVSATKFADEIGVQRSSISHILSGRNNPGYDFIQKFLTRYKTINAEWLIMGTGPMVKQSITENSKSEIAQKPVTEMPPDLFQQKIEIPQTSVQSPEKKPSTNIPEIIPSRNVSKIVLFYTDNTFEEFAPQK